MKKRMVSTYKVYFKLIRSYFDYSVVVVVSFYIRMYVYNIYSYTIYTGCILTVSTFLRYNRENVNDMYTALITGAFGILGAIKLNVG